MRLFKSKTNKQLREDMNILVQEIHDSFNSEGDRLLEEAKQIILKAEQEHTSIIINTEEEDIANRLRKIGFTLSSKVAKITEKYNQKQELEKIKKINEETAKLVQHYNFYYPQNKFINKEGVERLCTKYNLIYGRIDQYIGDVPTENLVHIEKFKVRPEDKLYYRIFYNRHFFTGINFKNEGTLITYKEYKEDQNKYNREHFATITEDKDLLSVGLIMFKDRYDIAHKYNIDEQLLICAPKKDFKLEQRQEIKDFKIIDIPDPVVLYPVVGGYLIVTAWGIEAKDEQIINPNSN